MALADELLAVLDNPTHMWTHALKELSADGQRLFLTLTLLPKPVSSNVLQTAYTSQALDKSGSFIDALRSLEDSFVSIEKPYDNFRIVGFRNPSLQDFANAYLDANPDWLDSLLSTPKYYEQIIGVFSLAMAQGIVLSNPSKPTRKNVSRYPGIKAWVEQRASELLETAVDLYRAKNAEYYTISGRTRLGQVLEVMAKYGAPTTEKALGRLKEIVIDAISPRESDSADAVMLLLKNPTYRGLMDTFLHDNAAARFRKNVLYRDSWRFAILVAIDQILDLEWEESWYSWGSDYTDYADQLIASLAETDDDDDLRKAIDELNSVSELLNADFDDKIHTLEERRKNLSQDDDYDDRSQIKSPNGRADESGQLAKVFGSLL